jgi:hypothetical protein
MPTKLVGEYQMIDVVKTNVFAVCLSRREDVGPAALARGGYSKLYYYPIKVATPVYELEGTLEWAGRFDFAAVMMQGIRDFVPVYDTVLTAILIQSLRVESPAVLFNRRQVDFLAQVKEQNGKNKCPHRLVDQDVALSRLKPEFESPWGHQNVALEF